jgi:hypothetical protein
MYNKNELQPAWSGIKEDPTIQDLLIHWEACEFSDRVIEIVLLRHPYFFFWRKCTVWRVYLDIFPRLLIKVRTDSQNMIPFLSSGNSIRLS